MKCFPKPSNHISKHFFLVFFVDCGRYAHNSSLGRAHPWYCCVFYVWVGVHCEVGLVAMLIAQFNKHSNQLVLHKRRWQHKGAATYLKKLLDTGGRWYIFRSCANNKVGLMVQRRWLVIRRLHAEKHVGKIIVVFYFYFFIFLIYLLFCVKFWTFTGGTTFSFKVLSKVQL